MSGVALVACKKLVYAGQGYTSGQSFEARDQADASLLVTLGLASRAPVQKVSEPEPEPVIQPTTVDDVYTPLPDVPPTEAVSVETPPEESPEPEPVRVKRAYKRRDMTAEE
jgi:hypothetical protein